MPPVNRHFLRACLAGVAALVIFGTAPPALAAKESIDAQLAKLQNADAEVRLEALRGLQTSLDPRLPDGLLRLLADEGNSIRRLAARGVGSRWWQIPQERVPVFVKALKKNEKSEFEDEVNMVRRGLALLNRDYRGNMLIRSPNKRWVIYERRGLPCLIDTPTGTEELLGWTEGGAEALDAAWGNGTLEASVRWHAQGDIAALSILLGRKDSAVWIWRHQGGVRKLGMAEVAKALGIRPSDIFSPGGFFTEIKEWKGDDLRFEVTFTTSRKGEMTEHTATLAWNAAKKSLRVISR
jgi:hypothetical protein